MASSKTKDRVIAATTRNVRFLEVNETRKGFMIQNTSTAVLFLRFGKSPASATNHSVRMPPNSYYEDPFEFTGAVYGVWDAVNGQAIVTEIP
jgi:hypothetical protein